MSSGKSSAVGNMHNFLACKIDVVNKQLVSTLSWNNPLSETPFDESNILTDYKHLDAKKKHEGVYNMYFHLGHNFL